MAEFGFFQILRNILSQSQLNLTSPRDQVDEVFHKQQRLVLLLIRHII